MNTYEDLFAKDRYIFIERLRRAHVPTGHARLPGCARGELTLFKY